MLKTDDPLILFVGTITDCCQELGNCGESSMIHSAVEKNGNVFVIEEIDENGNPVSTTGDNHTAIVAQSWVWRNKDRLCFDNIECIDDYTLDEKIIEVYEEAGRLVLEKDEKYLRKLLEEGKINQVTYDEWILKEVTVGMRYTELDMDKFPSADIVLPKETGKWYEGISTDELYYDSEEKQVIVAKISKEKQKELEERAKLQKENVTSEPEFYDGREL